MALTELRTEHDTLVADAMDLLAGPSLVLDHRLRVVQVSTAAMAMVGDIPPGTSAPSLLCGSRKKRPVAEALEAGRAIEATVPLGDNHDRLVRVRSLPIGVPVGGGRPRGWVLLLEDAGESGDDVVNYHGMWTRDAQMRELFRMIERVADGDVTVLIRGESGTGKELVAQALHQASSRRQHPFQAVNCAALPPTLLEAELFGTVRGAFTGAHKDTPGLIRTAHRGTLFLDEVAEIPLELQAKLLRVLETRMVLPVGGTEPVRVDVRILSATHRALRKEVEAGRFRADLMYRLRVVPLFLPPLRERPDDVPLLAKHFLDDLNAREGKRRHVESIAPATMQLLSAWRWAGNVRELKNVLHYAHAMGDGPVLIPRDLPRELIDGDDAVTPRPEDDYGPPRGPSSAARRQTSTETTPDRGLIEAALREADGNRDDAAAALGISRVTLWRWMKDAGIAVRPRRRRRTA